MTDCAGKLWGPSFQDQIPTGAAAAAELRAILRGREQPETGHRFGPLARDCGQQARLIGPYAL